MKYKIYICSILFLLNNTYSTMKVQSPQNDTIVSYDPSSDQLKKFYLELTVIGDGIVYDGSAPIEKDSITFEMTYEDSKTLILNPNKNSYLKKVEINGRILNSSETDAIRISHMQRDMNVLVEFADYVQEKEPVRPLPDSPAFDKEESLTEFEKDVIIIITQDIPLEDIPDDITDDFIRKYLDINDDYEILSHNVQDKVGYYDITIRLSDGSIRNVKVKVVGPEQEEEIKTSVTLECRIHIIMLILLLIYTGYNIVAIVRTRRKIDKLKQRQRKEGKI